MDRDSVLIRPATRADVPQVAAIVRERFNWVFSDRGWQHRWETTPERARMLALVAVADGEVLGHGGASLDASTSVEGAGGLGVTVVERARPRDRVAVMRRVDRASALGRMPQRGFVCLRE